MFRRNNRRVLVRQKRMRFLKDNFRPSGKSGYSHIEGGYSDVKATTKFDVVTKAENAGQRNAAVADLLNMFA